MSKGQEFIRGVQGITAAHKGCIATIGSFDGVHLGHQTILARLKVVAAWHQLPSLVIVFEPQPYEYFSKEKAPARLMRLREKVTALLALGVDRVLCLKFDRALRNLSAHDFVSQILVHKLGVKHLEIGDDFRFGCDRAGDFALLQTLGKRYGFEVCDTQSYRVEGKRVSSTRIRKLLTDNRLEHAKVLLGKRFGITGRVIYGKQLGRTIGVPTANIGLGRYRCPVQGVYAVKAQRLSAEFEPAGRVFCGVANVGVRPTIAGEAKPMLEVHMFDFAQVIYGQWLRVRFYHRLRGEQKFDSVEQLKSQIHNDMQMAKAFFQQPTITD